MKIHFFIRSFFIGLFCSNAMQAKKKLVKRRKIHQTQQRKIFCSLWVEIEKVTVNLIICKGKDYNFTIKKCAVAQDLKGCT
jgi:hypothetical protein